MHLAAIAAPMRMASPSGESPQRSSRSGVGRGSRVVAEQCDRGQADRQPAGHEDPQVGGDHDRGGRRWRRTRSRRRTGGATGHRAATAPRRSGRPTWQPARRPTGARRVGRPRPSAGRRSPTTARWNHLPPRRRPLRPPGPQRSRSSPTDRRPAAGSCSALLRAQGPRRRSAGSDRGTGRALVHTNPRVLIRSSPIRRSSGRSGPDLSRSARRSPSRWHGSCRCWPRCRAPRPWRRPRRRRRRPPRPAAVRPARSRGSRRRGP